MGLPKAAFTVIARKSPPIAFTQYRGTIDKHIIEIVAWAPDTPRDGVGFCDLVTIELVDGRAKRQ